MRRGSWCSSAACASSAGQPPLLPARYRQGYSWCQQHNNNKNPTSSVKVGQAPAAPAHSAPAGGWVGGVRGAESKRTAVWCAVRVHAPTRPAAAHPTSNPQPAAPAALPACCAPRCAGSPAPRAARRSLGGLGGMGSREEQLLQGHGVGRLACGSVAVRQWRCPAGPPGPQPHAGREGRMMAPPARRAAALVSRPVGRRAHLIHGGR